MQATLISSLPPALPPVPVFRLTVKHYHAMIKAGIFTPDDRVELIDGWLVQKMSKSPRHCVLVQILQEMLIKMLPPGWCVKSQDPITLAESEPEPDLTVVRGKLADYYDRHPGPSEIAMVVEFADSSLDYDQGMKKQIYARSGLPVYWIVNLQDWQIEVYTQPTGGEAADYAVRQDYSLDAEVAVMIDQREIGKIALRDVLPR